MCNGHGCGSCNQTGEFEISQCPYSYLARDITDAIKYARFAERGAWPKAGGLFNQTQSFVDSCDFIWMDQRAWRAELGIKS